MNNNDQSTIGSKVDKIINLLNPTESEEVIQNKGYSGTGGIDALDAIFNLQALRDAFTSVRNGVQTPSINLTPVSYEDFSVASLPVAVLGDNVESNGNDDYSVLAAFNDILRMQSAAAAIIQPQDLTIPALSADEAAACGLTTASKIVKVEGGALSLASTLFAVFFKLTPLNTQSGLGSVEVYHRTLGRTLKYSIQSVDSRGYFALLAAAPTYKAVPNFDAFGNVQLIDSASENILKMGFIQERVQTDGGPDDYRRFYGTAVNPKNEAIEAYYRGLPAKRDVMVPFIVTPDNVKVDVQIVPVTAEMVSALAFITSKD